MIEEGRDGRTGVLCQTKSMMKKKSLREEDLDKRRRVMENPKTVWVFKGSVGFCLGRKEVEEGECWLRS